MRRAEGNEMERKQTLIEEQVKVGDLNGRKGSWTETDRRRETHFLVTAAQTVHGSDDDGLNDSDSRDVSRLQNYMFLPS